MSFDSVSPGTATAFKHPQCGGIIFYMVQGDLEFFQCDTCSETAESLERLALGKPVILRRSKRTEHKDVADS